MSDIQERIEEIISYEVQYGSDFTYAKDAGNKIMALFPQWIDVKDELPKKSGDYLVRGNDTFHPKGMRFAYFTQDKFWAGYAGKVTHWQPLPKV